jgi:hypothetical protein
MLFLFQFSEAGLGGKHTKGNRAFIGDVLKKISKIIAKEQ